MVRIRRLQARDERGKWYPEAYAIETPESKIVLRYPLTWEYLGGRYNAQIAERNLALAELEQVLSGRKLRWLAVETLPLDYEQALAVLDRECHVPTKQKAVVACAA